MKEITKKLHDKVIADFMPVIKAMADEGCSETQIVQAYKNHMAKKVNDFYSKHKEPVQLKNCFNLDDLKTADSKAEMIFYGLLQESGVKFTFQHQIGPYRADYLIMGFLVIEIDGPQHDQEHDERRDKYMRDKGYKIIRIPTWILMSCPEAAIQEIKEATKIRRIK